MCASAELLSVVAAVMLREEPPDGWRHPHLWEPQGGFVRVVDDIEPEAAPQKEKSSRASSSAGFLSCGNARRPDDDGDDDEEEWGLWSSIEKLLCSPPQRAKAAVVVVEEDPEPPLPAGTEERFMKASASIKKWRPARPPSDEEKLRLYALFKQGTEGRARGEPPPPFDLVGSAKWNAWIKLGSMARGRAMLDYIAEAEAQMARGG